MADIERLAEAIRALGEATCNAEDIAITLEIMAYDGDWSADEFVSRFADELESELSYAAENSER